MTTILVNMEIPVSDAEATSDNSEIVYIFTIVWSIIKPNFSYN